MVNTYSGSGAAIACMRLHQGLIQNGINSRLLLKHHEELILKDVYKFRAPQAKPTARKRLQHKIIRILSELKLARGNPHIDPVKLEQQRYLNNRPPGLEMFSFPNSNNDITTDIHYKESDVINLHWVAEFIDYQSFFQKNEKPVVWTLHDMNPFSGGEHYSEEYLGIDLKGRPVKRELTSSEKSLFTQIIRDKVKYLHSVENLYLVAPSQWLADKAKKSQVFGRFPIEVFHNGLNTNTFKPRDKKYSRELLNIPEDKQVVLFVADSLNNQRKGYLYLKKALEGIKNSNLLLCAIGSNNEPLFSSGNLIELGKIQNEMLMSIIYSAADVFVIPSVMDNLPNTVLESLCCGTPVIGFPIGGIPEVVDHGENGFVCPEISVDALYDTIMLFLSNPEVFDQAKIRRNAEERYSALLQGKRYTDLFQNLLNG